MNTTEADRWAFIHLVRSGRGVAEAARAVGRCRAWGHKWWNRFKQEEDWEALRDHSRAPRRQPKKLPAAVGQAIRRARSELEAEAQQAERLGYIGAAAIRARLEQEHVQPLPSISSIERELRRAGMTRPRRKSKDAVKYPHLHPTRPHELIQADILPRSLSGGTSVACFNAIDVFSRYPSGRQYEHRTAQNAADFLWSTWQEQGLPTYQQVDNEGCFSGGHTHPGVIGQVIRLALLAGVQLVFSPLYHPESNGFVERFHQDYAAFVWKEHLSGLPAVRQRSALFFRLYRTSRHQRQLQGHSPLECQRSVQPRRIPAGFSRPKKLPLTAGQVHFIREVDDQRRVKVLNMLWDVPKAQPHQGVWVTLHLTPQGATLSVFDLAPDASSRTCLAKHPFPLKEKVVPLDEAFKPELSQPVWLTLAVRAFGYLLYRLSTMS